jgi:hypothetical protein
MFRAICKIMVILVAAFMFARAAEPARPIIPVTSRIDAVSVYPDRALVVRKADLKLLPGEMCVVFQNLPENIMEDSVRVSGSGNAAASITDIRIGRGSAIDEASERLSALKKNVESLDTRIGSLDDRMDILGKKGDFLGMLMNIKSPSDTNSESIQKKGILEWQRLLAYFDDQLMRINAEKRRIEKEKKELQEQKQAVEYELGRFDSLQKKERRTVQVDVTVSRAGEEEMELTYMVPGPSWAPTYELRLATGKKEARLTCQAMVRQQTGEDWANARLTLSSSRPSEGRRIPELRTWYVDLVDSWGAISGIVKSVDGTTLPGVAVLLRRNGSAVAQGHTAVNGEFFFDKLNPGSYDLEARLEGFNIVKMTSIMVRPGQAARLDIPMKVAAIMEEIVVPGKPEYKSVEEGSEASGAEAAEEAEEETDAEELEETTAEYIEGDTATTFSVDSRQTVLSGDVPQKITAAVLSVEVEKEYVCVPKLDPTVYMQANFVYGGGFTLATGRCSLYLDDGYTANITLPRTSPGEDVRFNVGAVPGIHVKRERTEKKQDDSGSARKTVQLIREYQITLESFLKQPVSVTVLDQLPVTESKEVEIALQHISPDTEKATAEKEEKSEGELRWQIKLAPREKKTIHFTFRISHPKKRPLVGME